jgi:fatty-acyl-CoA synthase
LFALIAPLLPTFTTVKHLVIMDDGKGDVPKSVDGYQMHDYEELLKGTPGVEFNITDENLASSMCYTSGTTGNPKGVLCQRMGTCSCCRCMWRKLGDARTRLVGQSSCQLDC